MRMLVDDPDEEIVPAPCQVFDLICGTSTGGLIALLLGRLGLDCPSAILTYKELGPSISRQDDGMIWVNMIKGGKCPSAAFESLLAEVVSKYTGDERALLKAPKSNPDPSAHGSTDVSLILLIDCIIDLFGDLDICYGGLCRSRFRWCRGLPSQILSNPSERGG